MRANDRGAVGFVAAWRRANVALTRARRGVIVVGHAPTLNAEPRAWAPLLRFLAAQVTLNPFTLTLTPTLTLVRFLTYPPPTRVTARGQGCVFGRPAAGGPGFPEPRALARSLCSAKNCTPGAGGAKGSAGGAGRDFLGEFARRDGRGRRGSDSPLGARGRGKRSFSAFRVINFSTKCNTFRFGVFALMFNIFNQDN